MRFFYHLSNKLVVSRLVPLIQKEEKGRSQRIYSPTNRVLFYAETGHICGKILNCLYIVSDCLLFLFIARLFIFLLWDTSLSFIMPFCFPLNCSFISRFVCAEEGGLVHGRPCIMYYFELLDIHIE